MNEFKKSSSSYLALLSFIPLAMVTVLGAGLVNGAFGVFGAWSIKYLDLGNYNIRESAVVSTFHGLLLPILILPLGLIAKVIERIDPKEKILGYFVNPKSPLAVFIPGAIGLVGSHTYLTPFLGQKVINNFPVIKDFLENWSGKELEMNTRDYNAVMGFSVVTYALTLGSISLVVASHYDAKRTQPISSKSIGNSNVQMAENLSQQEESNITVTVPGNMVPR